MSLRSFKESLKACTSQSSAASLSSTTTTASASLASSLLPPCERRPPKSSLTQQLQRLEDDHDHAPVPSSTRSLIQNDSLSTQPSERELHELSFVSKKPEAPPLLESHGPYEPLLLSEPGGLPIVQVPASINCRLLEHQREGVRFLYGLYKNNRGGILGDDMGLGKTIQTIAFLAAVLGKDPDHGEVNLLRRDHPKNEGLTLIICPTSVIHNWEHELSNWGNFGVAVYHGINRDLILEKLGARGVEILLTSFDTFRIQYMVLCKFNWDIVVIDEAHRLKNEKSQLYKACLGIKTSKRFGLTGTIMQNKIMELFNLLDWVAPGSLGTREHFREYYDEPLKHGQRLSAPERFVLIADERKNHLATVLQKYLLRRTKQETIGHLMMGKEDNVVFCAMSELQKRVYRRMLDQPDVQALIQKDVPCSCGSPLTRAECCHRTAPKGIIWSYLHRDSPDGCDSCPFCLVLPCLIKLQQISNHLELIKPNPKDEIEKQRKDADLAAAVFGDDITLVGGNTQSENFMGLSDVEHCGKMRALQRLMATWIREGDKILLFSYSVRMLDILEKFLIRKGYCFSRLDGSTPMSSRQPLVDEFNSSPCKQVFLISTRAGGLGLNLVSANRVVVFDPNWNPAQDLQAQDRTFRYGQRRHVLVFRLLAAGSLEELVYTRQIYKQQLSNIAVSGKMERRYFEGVQDCKEFQGELFGICNLFRDLSDKLFTSEIVGVHEKAVKESVNPCNGLGVVPDSQVHAHENVEFGLQYTQSDESMFSGNGINANKVVPRNCEETMHLFNLLEGAGIMYAHRNEDIVNMKECHQARDADDCTNDKIKSCNINPRKRPVDVCLPLVHKGTNSEEKKAEYCRLAQFMGMEVVEFSKWLLSISISERKSLLLDYKRHKDQARKK
ncbi:switch 2 isoform X1 [Nymphaea colorata]|uniref:switch 2 isoform X1 n=1 Tax=Nymphaea colorata TaxID=210225 RepID=UPI00129E1627|nr:switch 2 isoform X1 [Nymphaea colorata]XP_031481070.1 switch 2 isoform X1 [Nymphaea colorata]